MGAGAGTCKTDPKDPERFSGNIDDSDTCMQVVGRVHVSRNLQPVDNVQEKGDPINAPSGPFVEVGYRDLGEIAFDGFWTVNDVPVEDSGTIGATAWHLSAGYSLPIARRFALFGLVGYSFWEVEENEIFDGVPYSLKDDGNSMLFGLGGAFQFTPNWFATLEWNRYADVGGEVGEDDVDALLVSMNFRF
jgi:opacity protein-like surface antigen